MALANELYAAPRIYEALIIGPIFAGAHKQNNKKRWIAMKPHIFFHCNFMVYSKICREILTKIYNQYQGFMACTLNCTLMSLPLKWTEAMNFNGSSLCFFFHKLFTFRWDFSRVFFVRNAEENDVCILENLTFQNFEDLSQKYVFFQYF